MTANLVTISHDDPANNYARIVRDDPYVIVGPGEYEVGGVFVIGVACYHDDEQGAKHGREYGLPDRNGRHDHLPPGETWGTFRPRSRSRSSTASTS